MFFVSLLNQLYWVVGCTLGGVLGSVAALNVAGVDFAMTALFVAIFLDQWTKNSSRCERRVGHSGLARRTSALRARRIHDLPRSRSSLPR